MPTIVPTVSVYAGDTITWPTYVIKDTDNVARNLSTEGWGNWQAQWRVTDDAVESLPLTVDATNTATGVLIVRATPEISRAMGGNGIWDIQATHTSGQIKTWLRGKTKWLEDVTRDA